MPKAARALLSQRRPKTPQNDAFEQANSMAERYNGMTRLEEPAYGARAGGRGGENGILAGRDFPVQLNKSSKQATRLQNKLEYVRNRNGEGPDFGEIRATEQDIDALQDLESQKQRISFESWLANYFDMNDPATAKLVEDMMPEYYEKRMEAIEHQAELQKNLALIRLRGPKNKTDLSILYLASTGKLPMPLGGVHQPDKWSHSSANLTRGLWNPRRYRPAVVQLSKTDPVGTLIANANAGVNPAYGQPMPVAAGLANIGGLGNAFQAGPRAGAAPGRAFGL
jgi:hypothetical protein